MTTKMTLSEMKAAMRATQTDFLALLDDLSAGQLSRKLAPDGWSVGVVLLHLSEAREHFAADIENLVASNFAAAAGRTLAHEGRLAAIALAEGETPNKSNIRTRLAESHQTIMAALNKLQEKDLNQTITNQNPKFGVQPLWDFLGHFVIEHDRLHLAQARAAGEEAAR